MKKFATVLLALLCMAGLSGCSNDLLYKNVINNKLTSYGESKCVFMIEDYLENKYPDHSFSDIRLRENYRCEGWPAYDYSFFAADENGLVFKGTVKDSFWKKDVDEGFDDYYIAAINNERFSTELADMKQAIIFSMEQFTNTSEELTDAEIVSNISMDYIFSNYRCKEVYDSWEDVLNFIRDNEITVYITCYVDTYRILNKETFVSEICGLCKTANNASGGAECCIEVIDKNMDAEQKAVCYVTPDDTYDSVMYAYNWYLEYLNK